MSVSPKMIKEIQAAVSIPVNGKGKNWTFS